MTSKKYLPWLVAPVAVLCVAAIVSFSDKPANQFHDYEIVYSTSRFSLESQVEMKLRLGYQCTGGLTIYSENGDHVFAQAMYK